MEIKNQLKSSAWADLLSYIDYARDFNFVYDELIIKGVDVLIKLSEKNRNFLVDTFLSEENKNSKHDDYFLILLKIASHPHQNI